MVLSELLERMMDTAVLQKCVNELYEALALADALMRGANMNRDAVERKVSAALRKAREVV